jgi:NAD(P)-dependent dehydrogenase (short-subunit alcohol dehydrogenase family)
MDFQSKVALITGGATGIEKAVAKGFLAGGAPVVLHTRKKDALTEAATELDPSGEKVAMVAGDIGIA